MSKKIAIEKIVLRIGDKELHLTPQEARELRRVLDDLLSPAATITIPVPVPTPWVVQPYPYPSTIIWTYIDTTTAPSPAYILDVPPQ